MIGPLIPQGIIGAEWSNVSGLVLGMGFGYVLESSGFSSSRKLAGVFYGYDFVVLKVFFTAAITAMVGLLYFSYLSWIDFNMIYINPAFLTSAIIGGIIMGLGFIMGGFCPGTSFCGAAIGKIDAMIFTLGMFVGIILFSEAFPLLEKIYYGGPMGNSLVNEVLGISQGLFALILIVVAIGAFIVATIVEKRVKKVDY
ncbi:MAG: YeeE/YedE thiosulfate transporter family protein [Bacteroidales bacterium]